MQLNEKSASYYSEGSMKNIYEYNKVTGILKGAFDEKTISLVDYKYVYYLYYVIRKTKYYKVLTKSETGTPQPIINTPCKLD